MSSLIFPKWLQKRLKETKKEEKSTEPVEDSRIVYNIEGNRCVARMEPLEDTKESLICPKG